MGFKFPNLGCYSGVQGIYLGCSKYEGGGAPQGSIVLYLIDVHTCSDTHVGVVQEIDNGLYYTCMTIICSLKTYLRLAIHVLYEFQVPASFLSDGPVSSLSFLIILMCSGNKIVLMLLVHY